MTTQIVIMTDEDVQRWSAANPDAGLGALVTDQGPLPLKVLDVQTQIEGLFAETTLTQAFVNTHSHPLAGRSVGDGMAVDTDAVPDASRISPPVLLPGYPNPVRFSMNVEVSPNGVPIQGFKSSLHAIVSETAADGTLRLAVQPGERVN